MYEILKQLATPAIITGIISGLYAYFQKKKEEYREYVYKNKQENFKELAHRIQISKRLLDIKVEKNIPLISSAKIWFYLLQYAMLLLQLFLIYSVYNRFIEQHTEFSSLLACCLIMVVSLIFLLPELSVNESDDKKSEIGFVFCLFFIVAIDTVTAYYSHNSHNIVFIVPLVGIVSLFLIVGEVILKAIIFGESEIGKVSTIYIEEYRRLQGPNLSERRFRNYFKVIPFLNKIKNLFHKDKREGNDDL